jgi:hypothetical protein
MLSALPPCARPAHPMVRRSNRTLACGLIPRRTRSVGDECPQSVTVLPLSGCPCASRVGMVGAHELRHACRATRLCAGSGEPSWASSQGTANAAFAAVLHTAATDVPLTFRKAPRSKFRQQYARVGTLFAGLLHVNSTLPLHVFVSGEEVETTLHLTELALLRRHGVHVHVVPQPPIPKWASWNHRSSFAKMVVFNMSLRLRSRLIYLDTDVLPMRNLDHLAQPSIRTPAVVFRGDAELLNTGLFVVDVRSQPELDEFWRLARERFACRMVARQFSAVEPMCYLSPERMRRETEFGPRDGSDQEIFINWAVRRRFDAAANNGSDDRAVLHELPTSYNAFPWQMNHSSEDGRSPWCERVHVLHKTTNLEKKGLSPECVRFIRTRQREVQSLLKRLSTPSRPAGATKSRVTRAA